MFERFTIQARETVAVAVEEAHALGHAAIGTEHLLIGLLRAPDTVSSRALSALGIELTETRMMLTRILGWGEPTEGQMPFTPEAQRALRLAVSEAGRRGRRDVEPADILSALVAEPGAGAALILLELGATPDAVRGELESHAADAAHHGRLAVWPGLEEPVAERELEVGWRGRAIALAALGAAVLARSAFGPQSDGLPALQMQVLVWLALGVTDESVSSEPGEAFESLPRGLFCDAGELGAAIETLRREQLVVEPAGAEEGRVAITPAGMARVEQWLERIVPLFAGWPPEHPGVDDATG